HHVSTRRVEFGAGRFEQVPAQHDCMRGFRELPNSRHLVSPRSDHPLAVRAEGRGIGRPATELGDDVRSAGQRPDTNATVAGGYRTLTVLTEFGAAQHAVP